MTREFRLPDIGEGIADAELLAWHVAVGDEVREDQPLAEVQTDKAVVDLPCPVTGRVLELRGEPGETVSVGAVLAVFAAEGEASATRAPAARRPLASPALRRLARDRGIDLTAVSGSGPGGRIVREDLDAPAPDADRQPVASPSTTAGTVVPLRGIRRAIARGMTEAWQTVPHITDHREVDATELMRLRGALAGRARERGDDDLARALTLTALLVKIAARAARAHPYVNASIDMEREEIVLHEHVHVGIATAAEDGLFVPVVEDAGRKTLAAVAREVAELVAAARSRRLTREQLSGGTLTVNNFGPLGVWLGTPLIKPPEVVNLGVGRIEQRAVVRDGEIVARRVIALSVSGDHRVLDGHTLGAFVSEVAALIADPGLLLEDAT